MVEPADPAWAIRLLEGDVTVRQVKHLHEVTDTEILVIASPAELNRLVALVRAGLGASGTENARPANSIEAENKSREERL